MSAGVETVSQTPEAVVQSMNYEEAWALLAEDLAYGTSQLADPTAGLSDSIVTAQERAASRGVEAPVVSSQQDTPWIERGKARVVALIVTGSLAAVGLAAYVLTRPEKVATQGLNQDVLNALTVHDTTVDCVNVVEQTGVGKTVTLADGTKLAAYEVGALKAVGDGANMRRHADDISTPFETSATDKDAQLRELEASICEDPELGIMFANLFANMQINGVKVVDLNSWLAPFVGDANTINTEAAGFMPLLGQEGTPSESLSQKAVDQGRAYQKVAQLVNTLLTRFRNDGVGSKATTLNFHLVNGGLVAGSLPQIALNTTQESLPSLILTLDEKTGQCLAIIGANEEDKRAEVLACQVPPTTPPPAPNPGGTPTPAKTPEHRQPRPTPSATAPGPHPKPLESPGGGAAGGLSGGGGAPGPEGTASIAPPNNTSTPDTNTDPNAPGSTVTTDKNGNGGSEIVVGQSPPATSAPSPQPGTNGNVYGSGPGQNQVP